VTYWRDWQPADFTDAQIFAAIRKFLRPYANFCGHILSRQVYQADKSVNGFANKLHLHYNEDVETLAVAAATLHIQLKKGLFKKKLVPTKTNI
jgi:hypothetical protein